MERTVDARGLACPQPVILTRKALQECDHVVTIVDNETASQNVSRMAERAGCAVSVESRDDGTFVLITRESGEPSVARQEAPMAQGTMGGPLVLMVSSEFMGRGEDDELGHVLMRAFFHTLGEVEPLPEVIVFLNSGVKLVVEGSAVLDDLEALAGGGIEILACGTCLGHFGLRDRIAVGEVSNMYTIAEILLGAGKVVNL